jgi:hypothetical protein
VIHIHIDGQPLSALFWSRLKTPQPPVELLPHRLDCHITPRSLTIPGFGTYLRIGHHFTSAAVPTFAFPTLNELLSGKTLATISAPTGSNPGPAGTGATTWPDLGDSGGSMGLSGVYRVLTAGGLPYKMCQGHGAAFSVPYAASYWFLALNSATSNNTTRPPALSPLEPSPRLLRPALKTTSSTCATPRPVVPISSASSSLAGNGFIVALVSGGLAALLM